MRKGIVLDLDDLHEGWPELLGRAGIQTLGLHNWAEPDKSADKIDALIRYIRSPEGAELLGRLRGSGIELEYELHAMSWLLPRGLFRDHPNWFRADEKGERTPHDNFCPSSPEALSVVLANAVRLAELLRPTTGRYYMWQDDNKPWCACERCRGWTTSEQNLLVMNAIAEAIREREPQARLSYLAYTATLADPPQQVKPHPGVFLEITGPGIHQMAEADPQAIIDSERFRMAVDRNLELFGREDSQVLEYWLDASLYSRWKKPAKRLVWDGRAVEADLAYYKSKGFQSVTTFAVFLDQAYFHDYGEPPVVEYGRLLAGQSI